MLLGGRAWFRASRPLHEQDDPSLPSDIDSAFAELGLTPAATEADVKAAWRRLVSQWHPDRNDSAAAHARMQRINRAVEAIREAGFGPAPTPPQADDHAPTAGSAEARSDVDTAPARTLHRRVKLTLEEAAAGCTRVLQGRTTESCGACAGAGWRVLGGHCPSCQGSGAVRQRAWFGFVGAATECADCHGGGIARQPCAACDGSGKAAPQRYRVSVRFPPGVRDGDQLRVDRQRHRALPGDLNLRIELLPHPFLTLAEDGTLHCELPVDGFSWMANRVVEVPTLAGLQPLALQREQRCYRLAGQGFPVERRGARGDQVVTLLPVFPERLSTDQQILLDQLIATTSGADGQPAEERLQRWQQALRAVQRRR